MRSAISLLVLLLFSMCGVQARSTQTEVQPESQGTGAAAAAAEVSTQLDVSAELKELRDMVMEQRVRLEAENTELRERLVASETKVAALETVTADQHTELTAMKERLETSETKVAALERVNGAQDERLSAGETTVEELKVDSAAQTAELTAVKTRLVDTEAEVETLKGKITEAPKVAFSAGLMMDDVGCIVGIRNLIFSNIITNVGGGYNSQTGFFTAPVKGVYYFRYTAMDKDRSAGLGILTLLNGEMVMFSSAYDDNGRLNHGYNGLTLQLEKGDTVNLQVGSGSRVCDDYGYHYTNFSGFLLFPL